MLRSFAVEIGTTGLPDWARSMPMVSVYTPSTNAAAVTIGDQSFGPGCSVWGGDALAEEPAGSAGDWATITVRVAS